MSEAQSKPAASLPRHKSAGSDVMAVIGISALSLVLSAHFQVTEMLFALTRRWEYFQLDELPFGLLVLAIGLIWLSWRRYRQAQLAEARLAGVLADNRRLAQEHLRIQELERKHLARELHDELGQYLNAIKLDAVAIAGGEAQFVTQTSLSIIRSVDHVHAAVSDMIGRLRPLGLDELGLAAAIEHCVDQWRRRLPGTHFSLTTRGELDELNEGLSLTLYRLIQEGLTNVYKHSAATQVHIVLERRAALANEGNQVLLTVADNGRGVAAGELTSGFGLSGMRERVEMVGGTFLLESTPGSGLSFEAHLPAQGK
jgi:glucose-6-phosphate-specific signal transduction histidine kinase